MNKQKQYGLIGYPLGHSFSQSFFSEKFLREGVDAMYSNYEIATIDQFQTILDKNLHLVGLNVTIPYKEVIIPLLTDMSDEAKSISAVNVVKITRSESGSLSLKGYNSDVIGFVNSIKPMIDISIHKKALVLGTGGASKAIVFGLNRLGLETQLVSRSKNAHTITYEQLTEDVIKDYKVIVNCTPLGTFPNVENAPEIPYELLGTDHLLYDLVYNPAETEFLKRGKERGAKTKNGAEMLELQALEAWRIWNNNDNI